jgi:hypothetical protein
MTIQFKDTVRNGRLDAIETVGGASCALRVYTGAQPADVTQANAGTMLAEMNLAADWLAAASGGAKAIAGTWQDASADAGAGATPGHFRIYNSQATKDGTTCIIQGSAGIGSGDMNFNGTITAGQVVTVTAFTLTDGNA